jgi:hypothetical protein
MLEYKSYLGVFFMTVYYVFQGMTYDNERIGGYVWSPQLAKGGRKNAGYDRMTKIRKGDFILHSVAGELRAISYATSNCYKAPQPQELIDAPKYIEWGNNGYKVDCKYFNFDTPISVKDYKDWLKHNFDKDSAFTIHGTGKQQYMCNIAEHQAIFLLEQAIKLQRNPEVLSKLKVALEEIAGDKISEYNELEKELINRILEEENESQLELELSSNLMPQETTVSVQTGRVIPKRNPLIAVKALIKAKYLCEYNNGDRTFFRKNSTAYTDPHHLIPISKYGDFSYSLDVVENIVSLCSHHHNLLHYGRFEDKIAILRKLYAERKLALKKCGIDIEFEQLISYYK